MAFVSPVAEFHPAADSTASRSAQNRAHLPFSPPQQATMVAGHNTGLLNSPSRRRNAIGATASGRQLQKKNVKRQKTTTPKT